MKTRLLNIFLALFFISTGMTVMAEDFVTVYYHDGTHKMFFVSDIEHITMSHLDVDSVTHNDFQSQIVETNYGTYIQMINKIDSVVFSHVDMAYPRTDDELEATSQLATVIAEKTNDIVDSLENEGKRDLELVVKEFMKIPGVIDAEVNEDESSITLLSSDSIYHDFIFDYWLDETTPKQAPSTHKIPVKTKNQRFIPINEMSQSQTAQTAPLHEAGEIITAKDIKSVLILAPFENITEGRYQNDIERLSNDIKELLNVEPNVYMDNEATIDKFKGDFMDDYDLIIISTHGGRNVKKGVCFGSISSKGEKIKNLPEIRYMIIHKNRISYYSMTEKFLDNASFNNSIVFSYACSGFDGMYAKNSMSRTFLDKGALAYCGSMISVYHRLNISVSNNIIRAFCNGIPLQDAFIYWKNCSQTEFYYNKCKEYYNDNKSKLGKNYLREHDPDILKINIMSSFPVYSKSPYPYNLKYDISSGDFSWECQLKPSLSTMFIPQYNYIFGHDGEFPYTPTYDVYVNGMKINENDLTENHFSWPETMNKTFTWYVVAKFKDEINTDYDEYISTFKSNEETFTIEVYPTLSLSINEVSLKVGENTTIDITAGSGSYSIEKIEPTDVVIASINENHISIEALAAGTAIITVKDDKSGETATIEVTVQVKDIPAEAIDLGLPSGTLWASYNVGATKPEEYGGYYAWGETEEKEVYYWTTYSHCDGVANSCHDIGTDISGTEYDVAHVRWGGEWRMPTAEDFKELVYKCDHQVTTQNGVYGFKFTGPNGNSIFFPAAGYRFNTGVNKSGSSGEYWSSTVRDNKNYAYDTSMSVDYVYWDCYINRFAGLPVRPVKNSEPALENLVLSSTSPISLKTGETATVHIISGNGIYSFENTNPKVATYEIEGNTVNIVAVSAGTTTITVKDDKSGQTAPIEVTVTENTAPVAYLTCPDDHHPHLIDLGLPSGTKWACCNVGADKPEDNGGYYAWGETEEKDLFTWGNYTHCDGTSTSCHNLGGDISGTQYDIAYVKWGENWCMPSYPQLYELNENCSYKMATVNGIDGRIYTGKNGGSIFLPMPGYRWYDELNGEGLVGLYWSSTQYTQDFSFAVTLYFNTYDDCYMRYDNIAVGISVRPVAK